MRSVEGVQRGDIVSTRVEHTATHLIISTTFVRLERASETGPWYRVGHEVQTQAGWWYVELESGKGDLGEVPPVLYRRNLDHRVTCAGMDYRVDFPQGVVVVSVPRACLLDPPWARVNPLALTFHEFPGVSRDYGYLHDKFSKRVYAEP